MAAKDMDERMVRSFHLFVMTDESRISSCCRQASASSGFGMGSTMRADGAEEKANRCAGFGLEVLALLQALTDQERMSEDDDGPHDQLGRVARVDRLELARLDAVAQDQFRHILHDLLVRADGIPAVL